MSSETPPPSRSRRPYFWGRVLLNVAGGFALVGLYLGIEQFTGNFHTVLPGAFYRAAQLDVSRLPQIKAQYGIATIINLRGPSTGNWYRREVEESRALGIEHVDFRMSPSRELTQQQVVDLIALMRTAKKPLLVHCRGGADRTGIASALYVSAIAGRGERAAEEQLSLFYGHFPIPRFPAWAMDETWERIEPWLGFPNS